MLTIARFSKAEDAHLFRHRLEAGGVAAYLQDENTVQMDWLYSNAIGGVRVQISEEDVEEARELLHGTDVPQDEHAAPVCPKCSSHQTAPHELVRRLSFLSVLLLGFPCVVSRKRWKCADCGNTWK